MDIFIGDQVDSEFWRQFISNVPHIDIVIDDGGHQRSSRSPRLRLSSHIFDQVASTYARTLVVNTIRSSIYVFGLSRGLHTYRAGTKP